MLRFRFLIEPFFEENEGRVIGRLPKPCTGGKIFPFERVLKKLAQDEDFQLSLCFFSGYSVKHILVRHFFLREGTEISTRFVITSLGGDAVIIAAIQSFDFLNRIGNYMATEITFVLTILDEILPINSEGPLLEIH